MLKKVFILLFIILIGVIAFWFLFFYSDWKEIKKLEDSTSGIYIVDLSHSNASFTEKEIEYYKEVILELKKNGIFKFSKPVPASWGSSSGEWKVEGKDIERHVSLEYENGKTANVSACIKVDCFIEIAIPVYAENLLSDWKYLKFQRMK